MTTRGMVLGKFLPPHEGHVYLIEFARRCVDELFVVVGTLPHEPIAGALRVQWMRELFPTVRVIHLTDENPQDPSEHPDFWPIWKASLQRVLPWPLDAVFASESYGVRLAEELGARFVPVDPRRAIVPVSGAAVRADPIRKWRYLPAPVRAYYARRICVFGPESTGKTTLAGQLAKHYETQLVPEYARTYLELQARPPVVDEMLVIARGQIAAEDALAARCNRVLITDTDALTTQIWSEVLFGGCDPAIEALANSRRYDLTIVTDADIPYTPDPVRYQSDRTAFLERGLGELTARDRRFLIVRGDREARLARAIDAIDELLAQE